MKLRMILETEVIIFFNDIIVKLTVLNNSGFGKR